MTDVPVWCWWIVAGAAAVLVLSLGARLVHAALSSRTRSGAPLLRRVGAPWVMAFAATLSVLLALTLAAAPRVQGEYTSSSLVALLPRDPINTGADTMILLAPRYVSLLESPEVLDAAAEDANLSVDDLRSGASPLVEPQTTILRIEVTSTDPADAAAGAQALSTSLVAAVTGDSVVRARPIGDALPPTGRANPSMPQILALGGFLALVGAAVAAAAAGRRWSR